MDYHNRQTAEEAVRIPKIILDYVAGQNAGL